MSRYSRFDSLLPEENQAFGYPQAPRVVDLQAYRGSNRFRNELILSLPGVILIREENARFPAEQPESLQFPLRLAALPAQFCALGAE